MLSKTIKKLASISLAFLVLFSTMSFSINEHYCGGSLVDTSLFVKADTCMMSGMEMSTPDNATIVVDNCCNDVITVVDGQDEVQQTHTDITFEQELFITTFVYTYSNLFSNKENSIVSYRDYIPPNLVKDIQILDETFLI